MFSHNNRILISKKFQVLKAVCRTERICRCHSNNKLGDTALLTVAPSSSSQQQQQQQQQREFHNETKSRLELTTLSFKYEVHGVFLILGTGIGKQQSTLLGKCHNTCQNFKIIILAKTSKCAAKATIKWCATVARLRSNGAKETTLLTLVKRKCCTAHCIKVLQQQQCEK